MPFQANVPVVLDGVTVVPGDYVLAVSDCAVIIPAGDVQRVFDEAERIEDADARFIEQIRHEDPAELLRRGSDEV